MKLINTKKKIGYLILLFLISASTFQIFTMNTTKNFKDENNHKQVQTSAQESYVKQWIVNPLFTSTDNWISTKGGLGDPQDVNAYIGNDTANFEVLGKKGTFSLAEKPINGANWMAVPNPDFPHGPTSNFSDAEGLKVYHLFDDHDANQNPSVHWDRNFTMPVDMSDYVITSASIQTRVNATVDPDVDCPGDTLATDGGASLDQQESYDYVRFYVLISDLPKNNVYEIAYLQPTDLGQGNPPGSNDLLSNTYLIPIPTEVLVFYLTSVLNTDYFNFTITLGIRIYTADNSNTYDNDEFHELLINSVTLNFTYEKKINQQTSVSWNQDGDKISDIIPVSNYSSFEVTEAILNFKYRINDTWSSSSPNSEMRILINNIIHTETIKLSAANSSFEYGNPEGFDVTSLISDDVNLSIQLFLADEFELNRTIAVSIDNISLYISYTVFFDDYQTNLQLFLNGDDKTLSPSIILPIGQNLTITVKYTNQTGGHLPGAGIQLTGVGIIENLKEFADNYSITINVTQQLSMGINYLNIEATKTNYQTKLINPTINVRKLNTEIITVSGESNINIDVGENAQLEIMLNDTDNDELIRGAIVTYTWNLDPIPRVLTENNGIYEGEIENPPEGFYTITILVFVGEDYEFEDFEITLNVGAYIPATQPDFGWLIYILIGAILGLVLIFTLYQTHFKFPPTVRKIRKLKKKVRKTKKTKQIIVNTREQLIKDNRENRIKDLNLENIQLENGGKIEKIPINKEEEI